MFTGQSGIAVLSSVVLLQTCWPAWHDAGNNVSWSLCCEAFFYAVFPWLVIRLGRLDGRAQWRAAATFYVLVSAVLVGGSVLAAGRYDDPLHWFPVTNAAPFVLGVVVGLQLRAGWRPSLRPRPAWLVVLAASVVVVALRTVSVGHPTTGIVITVMTPAFVMLIAAYASSDIRGVRTVCNRSATIYAGKLSFAFYLVHFTIMTAVITTLGLAPGGKVGAVAVIMLVLVVASVVAAALHHGVELPARQWLLRLVAGSGRCT